MGRRSGLLLGLAAAISAAIAAAVILIDHTDAEPSLDSRVTVVTASAPASMPDAAPASAPALDAPFFGDFLRASVDWSAVYQRVLPSLVAVVTERGSGSGFFVTPEGHIVTNHHVITGAQQVRIVTHGEGVFDAELIASDAGNDIALLKIEPDGFDVIVPEFADLDDVRVGDPVGALGAPFGLPNTLTVGIVSGLDRTRPSGSGTLEPLRDTIQTDAALNPGNSGGMLVDGRGRLLGIPTQIESPDRSSSGIGFAVSVEALARSLPTLLSGQDVERSYLGLVLDERETGLYVSDVTCDSTADRAEVHSGDRIARLNGRSVDSLDALVMALQPVAPGDVVSITVGRGGDLLRLQATAGAWPTEPPASGCG